MQYSPLEKAVHIIIILVGGFLTYLASTLTNGFMQDLLLGIGTNLIVVTIVFAIFNYFRLGNRTDSAEIINKPTRNLSEDTTPRGFQNILKDRKDTAEDPLFPRSYDGSKKGVKDEKK